jgi:hypothetical protein
VQGRETGPERGDQREKGDQVTPYPNCIVQGPSPWMPLKVLLVPFPLPPSQPFPHLPSCPSTTLESQKHSALGQGGEWQDVHIHPSCL